MTNQETLQQLRADIVDKVQTAIWLLAAMDGERDKYNNLNIPMEITRYSAAGLVMLDYDNIQINNYISTDQVKVNGEVAAAQNNGKVLVKIDMEKGIGHFPADPSDINTVTCS